MNGTARTVSGDERTLGEWLAEGPFVLALSSGFFGFFAHTGLISVLEEEGLRPSAVTGSSAGALVGALWGSGLDAKALEEELHRLRRRDFWDPGVGLGLLRGRRFRRHIESMVGAGLDEGPIPARVSTYDVLRRRTRVWTEGPTAPVIHASCAVPLMFQPVWLEGAPHLDGGIRDRPGIAGVDASERVLCHHLVSGVGDDPRPAPRSRQVCLVLQPLPRSGPFRLEAGRRALRLAREGARRALREPVRPTVEIDLQVFS